MGAVLTAVERVAKWSIDAESVENSSESWASMVRKQARVPVLMATFVLALPIVTGIEPSWLYVSFAVFWVLFTSLPALGAYCYYRERRGEDGE